MKPTIGRKVWFRPAGSLTKEQPLDATIAFVHNDHRINIGYRDKWGNPAAAQEVALAPPGYNPSDYEDIPYCEWMPYQIQQAVASEVKSSEGGSKAADILD